MNTALSTAALSTAALPPAIDPHPVRSVLRSTGVLLAALTLTVGVLVALASVVDTWT